MRDTLIVIGNGPSLRGFDLRSLRGVDTLGMNAAYRHWDRIGWYPDIYACLDDELINTHWKEICRLVDSGCVKQAFLSGQFLTFVPAAARDPRYSFLDSFVEDWHRVRGSAFGLDHVLHPAFSTSAAVKITTGSYAVRYAIACGYRHIALMGIDLKYIERVPEARSTGGIRLEMVETPRHNPNYFFDDYQQAGDTFQVPNPAAHDGDLHLASFRALRDDAVAFNYDVEIVNTNLQSALHEHGVLPYQLLEVFLNRRVLGAIVVPTNAREIDAILDNIWLWDQPAFAPFLHLQERDRPRLVYWFNNETGRSLEPAIVAAFQQTRTLKHCLADLEFRYLALHGGDDVYVHDSSAPPGPKEVEAGPIEQLIEIVRSAADLGRFVFYMGTDCVPIRADWLGRLQDVVRNAEPFWVMGSICRGSTALQRPMTRDISRNAIYAVGDPQFQDFVASVWQPEQEHVAARDSRYARDMVPEPIDEAQPLTSGDRGWQLRQATAHQFRYTDIIRNYAGRGVGSDPGLIHQTLREFPATYLIHGRGFAGVVHRLKEATDLNHAIAAERERRYWQIVRDTHDVVAAIIPRDATVLVISKGDDQLLNLDGRPAWHFPRASNGAYAGYHPADSGAAIAELEALRAKGADFLLAPKTAFWWFSFYPGFREHLDTRYLRLETPDCCALYRLSPAGADPDRASHENSGSSAG